MILLETIWQHPVHIPIGTLSVKHDGLGKHQKDSHDATVEQRKADKLIYAKMRREKKRAGEWQSRQDKKEARYQAIIKLLEAKRPHGMSGTAVAAAIEGYKRETIRGDLSDLRKAGRIEYVKMASSGFSPVKGAYYAK